MKSIIQSISLENRWWNIQSFFCSWLLALPCKWVIFYFDFFLNCIKTVFSLQFTHGVRFTMQSCTQHFQTQVVDAYTKSKPARTSNKASPRFGLLMSVTKAFNKCFDWAQYNRQNRTTAARTYGLRIAAITRLLRQDLSTRRSPAKELNDYCKLCEQMISKKPAPFQAKKPIK